MVVTSMLAEVGALLIFNRYSPSPPSPKIFNFTSISSRLWEPKVFISYLSDWKAILDDFLAIKMIFFVFL